MQLGTGHLQNGRYPAALRELIAAERLDPRNPFIQNNLGLTYYLREQLDLAAKHLARAVQIEPRYTDARNNLARVFIDKKEFDKAIEQLNVAREDLTYPFPEKTYLNLGLAYFHNQQFEKARDKLLISIRHEREGCYSNTLYGRTLYELKDFRTAATTLDRAIGFCSQSSFEEPHFFSALSYLRMGRRDEARSRFQEIISLYPESIYARRSRALLERTQ